MWPLADTYIASIATVLQGRRPLNAFEISIRRVSYLLLGFMAVMTPIVFIIQGLVNKDAGWKVRERLLSNVRAPG